MKRKVLIIEDDHSLARVLCHNLTYEGFEVAVTGDGLDAVTLAEEEKPDLVLLDLMLPGLDGIEVCRRLAQGPVRMGLIIITARNQKQDKLQAFQLGADDYVTKPFSPDELRARVKVQLRRRASKGGEAPDEVRMDNVVLRFKEPFEGSLDQQIIFDNQNLFHRKSQRTGLTYQNTG